MSLFVVGRTFCTAVFILFFLNIVIESSFADIVINEILAATDQEDAAGISLEWVEIYNTGSETIDLQDYGITDNVQLPKKWRFPALNLPAGSFLRLWATGYDSFNGGEYHLNFRLNRDGEYLAITLPDGGVSDSLRFPRQRRDISFGRQPDGSGTWKYFLTPTPGSSNTSAGRDGFASDPIFSIQAGVYPTAITVEMIAADENTEIRYTLDGSTPTATSLAYREPIDVTQTVVIRAKGFRSGYIESEVRTNSYIIENEILLPIWSLVTDPDNLWSRQRGIYANPSQHGIAWERPCSVEYFLKNGQRAFVEGAGVRIHGGASRTRSPKKSLRLYFRNTYGSGRLQYPLFSDTELDRFNQLTLRAGFNDSWGYDNNSQRPTVIHVRDQVVRDLHRDMGQLAVHGNWVELYLNGEYWGLYNLTERIEDDFFYQHTGLPDWDVIVDEEIRDGDLSAWRAFISWLQRTDFRQPGAFEEVQEWLDIENFTTYIILNTWMQNYDWPRHNWYSARERSPEGRWKFLIWDAEYSFGSGAQGFQTTQNTFTTLSGTGNVGLMFDQLVQNHDYRRFFYNRMDELLKTNLSEDHVHQRLQEQLDIVRPVIPREVIRWGYPRPDRGLPQMSIGDWENAVALAKRFIEERTQHFLRHVGQAVGPRPVSVEEWALY